MKYPQSKWSILGAILIVSFLLRLYQLTTPLADWHSFRQADTVSVAREFYKNGIDLLQPQYHDLSDIQSGQNNPMGWRMVEFPIVPALVAFSYPLAQPLGWDIHVWFRFLNILLSLISIFLLYKIALVLFGKKTALLAAGVFGFLPFGVFYSRTTLPEPSLITFSLAGTYFLFKLASNKLSTASWVANAIFATLFFSLALLTKPSAYLFLAPALVYVVLARRVHLKTVFALAGIALVSTAMLLWWRDYITNYPSGIPEDKWLFNEEGLRLRPAWFRWLFYERLTKLILGFFGIVPFFVGLVVTIRNIIVKKTITSQSWLAKITTFFYKPFSSKTISSAHVYVLVSCASALAYLIVVAGGNVRHDYYQVVLTPLIAIIYALGAAWLLEKKSVFPKALLITTTALGLIISANTIRGYYQINHWAIVRAGEAVNRLTPPEALVIAPYMGDTAFLYQTNRSGWPLGFYIDDKIKAGADYYVAVNYDDEARELEAKYETVEKTDDYLILNLNSPLNPR